MNIETENTRNPILPLNIHIPDGEGHVMSDGRLYIYGSYDDREDIYCSEKYHVVSTSDMKHWTIHDVAWTGQQVPWFNHPDAPRYPGIDWSNPTPFAQKILADMEAAGIDMDDPSSEDLPAVNPPVLFAPDCIEKDGRYYLYFCMSDDSEGVAVSDKPQGPFQNPVQLPCGGIDPAVFIDDDGQAYYYWGQLFSHGVRLNPDMTSFNPGNIVDNLVTEEEHFFHEGSSMRKIGDTYYYVYTDMERGKPTALGYSTGKSPLGPFTYRGILLDNQDCDPKSWNNHGSIECVNGRWYLFYHRSSRGTQQYRRLCVEPITINPDGSIDEVKMTSQGLGTPFAPGESIYGYQACCMKGTVYIGPDNIYTEKLMNISSGDEAVFRYIKSDSDWTEIRITCAGSGKIRILMNGIQAGTATAERDGQKVQIIHAQIQMPSGEYELTLKFEDADCLEVMEIILR